MRPMQAMRPMTPERKAKQEMSRAAKKRSGSTGHPTTSEVEYTPRELEFMMAIQEFKRLSSRQFPTWCEVLRVIDNLNYVQVGATQNSLDIRRAA